MKGKKMHTQDKPGVSIKQKQLDATRANTPGSGRVVMWSKNSHPTSFWSQPSSKWLYLPVAPALSSLAWVPDLCFCPSYSLSPLK